MLENPSTPAIISLKSDGGRTALHVASDCGHTNVVCQLLSAGADVNAQDSGGWAPLHWAACRSELNVIKVLLPRADASARDDDGWTALHWAATQGDVEILKLLVEFGADVLAETVQGQTALSLAGEGASFDVTRILLVAMQKDTRLLGDEDGQRIFDFEHQELEELCQELIRRYPKDIGYRLVLANLYLTARQYSSAAITLDPVLELESPSNVNAKIEEVIHEGFSCDSCEVKPIIGLRHKCLVCRNYDLCNKCFQIEPHPDPGHEYLTTPSNQWGQKRIQDVKV
jgi:hypothetical protein